MTEGYMRYQAVLERLPHVKRADVVEDGLGGYRVHVVSESEQSPRHIIRELVTLLRASGWHDIDQDNVTVVQMQPDNLHQPPRGRLKILGFSVGYGEGGYRAQCRLSHGSHTYEGESVAHHRDMAVAQSAVAAVNQAIGLQESIRVMSVRQLVQSGVTLVLVLINDLEGEIMAGNAIHRDTTVEETIVRAVLDAVNRRFVLYTGQKL